MTETKQTTSNWTEARRFRVFLYFSAAALAGLVMFYKAIMVSFSLGLLVAYLVTPLCELVDSKVKVKRSMVVLVLLLTLSALVFVAFGSLVPVVTRQIMGVLTAVPDALDYIAREWIEPLNRFLSSVGISNPSILNNLFSSEDFISKVSDQTAAAANSLAQSAPGLLGGALTMILVPVWAFFVITDLPDIKSGLKKLIPVDFRAIVYETMEQLDATLRSVIKGQVTVASILGFLYMVSFSIIGLPAALGIGAISGLCRIVPYLDVVVGGALCTVVILTKSAGLGVFVGCVVSFVIIQSLDGLLITPRIIGERAGLHPGVVIASVIAFSDWFGLIGVLVAVPLIAVVKVLLSRFVAAYRSSVIFKPQD